MDDIRGKTLYVILLTFLLTTSIPEVDASVVIIEFFYHPECIPCLEPKRLLERLNQEYSPLIDIEWMNMKSKKSLDRYMYYQMSKRPSLVFNHDPSTALYNLSEENLRKKIEYYIDNPSITNGSNKEINPNLNIDRPALTLPMVIIAGLVDGINPCAFSLLIFFLSFLFSLKRIRVNIIGMGLTYIVGNYIGYISIGLGLLYAVSISGIKNIFGLLGVVLLVTLGLLQIRDATTFEKPLMVFPRFVVPTFKRLTERETYPMVFLLGLLVSFFEFPCSGGVYIGIMFLIASNTSLYEGALYLIIYNLMFIAPLFIILIVGSNSEALLKMDEWRVVSRRRLKLISGIFLLFLAAVTAYLIYFQ